MACAPATTAARRDTGAMTMAVTAAGPYARLLKGRAQATGRSATRPIPKTSLHRYLQGLSGAANDAR